MADRPIDVVPTPSGTRIRPSVSADPDGNKHDGFPKIGGIRCCGKRIEEDGELQRGGEYKLVFGEG